MIKILGLILLLQPAADVLENPDEKALLSKGAKLEAEGQYEKALQVWGQALGTLETPSFTIGRAYIRLVAKQNMESYYQTASVLYNWGLSAQEVAPNADALAAEIKMLQPLASSSDYEQWQTLLKSGDPILYEQLQQFWQDRDPTLTTTYNERLIEHWQRIAHAKQHFTRDDDPPYGTDDRGIYWVRYGSPDRKYEGRIQIGRGDVTRVCSILSCNSDVMSDAVLELHSTPDYEVWIYDKPNENMKYNLVLIFGDDPSSGFGRINVLEDFIPSGAFTFSNRFATFSLRSGSSVSASEKMSPGMVLQWLYYEHLSTRDVYFGSQFGRMNLEWNSVSPDPNFGKFAGLSLKQDIQVQTRKNMRQAPEEVSTYEKTFPSIPLEVYQYRLFDEQGNPIFATFLESNPQQVFVNDLAANQDSMFTDDSMSVNQAFSNYELYHGLQIRNQEGEVISQSRVATTLVLDSTNTEPSTTVFRVPHLSEQASAKVYAELHNRHPRSAPIVETPFPKSLRGQGKTKLQQPDPLPNIPDQLQMGDLILGHQMQKDSSNILFPFVVANDRVIPADENLAVHVEIYNLQGSPNNVTRFQLSYEILPVNFLGWTREKKDEASVTLNLQATQDRFTEDLEIETELQAGKYVLRMQAQNEENGQVQREIEFEVKK